LCDKADFVAGDLAVLVLFASVVEACPEDLCIRRHLAAVNGVEDVVLVLEGRELDVLAEAPALGVRVAHRFAVVARVGRRKRKLLVRGREVFTGGRVESLDFGKCGPEGVVTEEVELVTGLFVRENRLGRRRRRGAGAVEDGGVTTTSRA
jgi:hypothetical protein